MTDLARSPASTSADKLASLFDDPSGADARPIWRRHRRTGFVVVAIAIALVVLLTTDAFGTGGASYRLAVVGDHDVDALLTGVATIEPVSQATVAFPVSGTVSTVNVKVGDQVAVGQALAALDPQSLMDTLHTQVAALAQAKLTLSKALAGQSVGGTGGTGGTGGSGSGGTGANGAALSSARTGPTPTAVLTAATPTDPQLTTLQQAVVSAQQGVDAALAAAKTALDNATSVCSAAGAGSTPPAPAQPAGGSAGTPGASAQDAGLTACQTALANVLTAQNATDTAQHKLADASTALDNYLAQKAATPTPTTTAPAAGSSGTGRTGSGSSGSGSAGSSGSSGGSASSGGFGSSTSRSTAPSAADLVSYQAAVDAATANVAAAYQALAQATITSPIQGTIVAVGITPGATVTAASSTANVVVQGAGGFEVTTSVNVTKISAVAVGQRATVVPDGSHTALTGKVTSISVAPSAVTNTATNYRVIVGLDQPDRKLGNGSTGTVTIVTKNAKAALAVPTSALTPLGRRYTVNVLENGTPTTVVVGVGVVGAEWTEITSGLTRGQEVLLADMSTPLPSSATSSSNGTTGTNGVNGSNGGRFFFGGGGGAGGLRAPAGGGTGR